MSAPEKTTFIRIANTLKRRAHRGRGATIEDMRQAAEQVLANHSASGRERLLATIADARAAIDRWSAGGNRTALGATLNALTGDAQSQGQILGIRLLIEVADRLAAFVSLLSNSAAGAADAKVATAIALHLDAMIVAVDGNQKAAIDKAGNTLLRNLQLTQRTIKVQ